MKLLQISANPHIREEGNSAGIMRDVVIAMLPTAIYGCLQWGFHSFLVVLLTTLAAVLTEYLYQKAMKLPVTISDWSAAVTGMILALNCPPNIPYWIPMVGSVFAILVVKQLYGGLGANFMNPALAARCSLLISFASQMSSFTGVGPDAVATATPLAVLKSTPTATPDLFDMFIGRIPGTIGEVSKICLLLGALYLIIRKVISPKMPLIYIGTVAVFTFIFGKNGMSMHYLLSEVLGGGLIFGAFFMITDYVTSPCTPMGQILFPILVGILTGLFRLFGGSAEGVSYAIILSNILVPTINNLTVPKAFGREEK